MATARLAEDGDAKSRFDRDVGVSWNDALVMLEAADGSVDDAYEL